MAKKYPPGSNRQNQGRRGKKNYREGDFFAVPLESSGYAVGVITRASPGGTLIGYFFGPRLAKLPARTELERYSPDQAVLKERFGDMGLLRGEWPILGQASNWNRTAWPMPLFLRRDPLTWKPWLVIQYSEDDPLIEISETPVSGDIEHLIEDRLAGHGAVEIRLSRILS